MGSIKVEYDREANILYIKFKESKIASTIPVADDVYMDLDDEKKTRRHRNMESLDDLLDLGPDVFLNLSQLAPWLS